MNNQKRFLCILAALFLFLTCITGFAACGKKEQTNAATGITVHGIITDKNGAVPSGKQIVFCMDTGEFLVGDIAEDGSFQINGLLPDTDCAVTVEDTNKNRYTEVSYFKMITKDKVQLINGGENFSSYFSVNVTATVKEVYVHFYLDNDTGYIGCSYIGTDSLAPQTATETETAPAESVTSTTREDMF